MRIQDYPYLIATEDDSVLSELEPGAVVIDSEHEVCQLKYDPDYGTNRWFAAGYQLSFKAPSLPAIVLVQEFGPDDYPEDWFELGGEAL